MARDEKPISEPFAGDLFERAAFAERLEKHIKRMRLGSVFAVDAPWGDGKSWLAKNWCPSLNAKGVPAIYIDAFKNDFVEDPFIPLAAEIQQLARARGAGNAQRLSDTAKAVGRALLPTAAKIAVGAASRIVFGTDALEEIKEAVGDASKGVEDAVEKAVEKRLEQYEHDKKSADHFRAELEKLASTGEQPIVVIIDELDRCKPTFAVAMIERIKHFFSVPGVAFVLFMNRAQLLEAIKGVYGAGIDAEAYLGKYVQFTVTLPKRRTSARGSDSHNLMFCERMLVEFGFPQKDSYRAFASVLATCADALDLSLRDIERGIILFSLAQPIDTSAPIAAWLIALNLSHPAIFVGIRRGEKSAHLEAKKVVERMQSRVGEQWLDTLLKEVHQSIADGGKTALSHETQQRVSMMGMYRGLDHMIELLAAKIDLDVQQ
jgi:hypothetical protein